MDQNNSEIAKRNNPINIDNIVHPPNKINAITKPKLLIDKKNKENKDNKEQKDSPKITDICFNNLQFKTQLVSIDISGVLKIWDVAHGHNGKLLTQFNASKTWLTSVDVEKSEGKKVATGTLDGKIIIYDINTKQSAGKSQNKDKPTIEMIGHAGAVQCTQFLSSQFIIAGSTDSQISVWDIDSPQRYLSIHQQHSGDVLTLKSYPGDPNIFLSGSSDLTAKLWDIRVKKPMQQEFLGHESAVNCCRFLPFNLPTSFATASDDATINLWDIRMKKSVVTFQDYKYFDGIYQIAISPSGRYIFAATENKQIKVFDLLNETGVYSYLDLPFAEGPQVQGVVKSIDISSDGFCLAGTFGSKGNHKDIGVII